MSTSILAGFAFGLSLIVAIGAQNAFVLRQGLQRRHVGTVVAICALSDVVLITAGVAGVGAAINAVPTMARIGYWFGAVFLLGYACVAARRALRPIASTEGGAANASGPIAAAGTALALTWLNPHVYLDTVVLLGSVASSYDSNRVWFGVGATVASIAWFSSLGFGARHLRPLFARPRAWQVLDIGIAALMLVLALGLVEQALNS